MDVIQLQEFLVDDLLVEKISVQADTEETLKTEELPVTTEPLPVADATFSCIDDKENERIRIYSRRWLILLVFIIFSTVNNMQSFQYVVVENIMTRYYNVSSLAIKCTAVIAGILGLILFFPISYMSHKLDLRYSCVVTSVATCIGSWIKFCAISPDQFILMFIGHSIVCSWNIIILSSASSVAAYWFGPDEIATATALGNFGMNFGIAIFAWLVPVFVKNHPDIQDIHSDMYSMSLFVAIVCTLAAISVILFFRNEPPLPPSKSRAIQKLEKKENYIFLQLFWRIIKKKNFILLWNSNGLLNGCFVVIIATMNHAYLKQFKDKEEDVGRITLIFILVGTFSGYITGKYLDKKKNFKRLLLRLCKINLLGAILFSVALNLKSQWAVYVTTAIIGIFSTAYTVASYEMAAELTYPQPENVAVAILNTAPQAYGFLLVVIANLSMKVYTLPTTHIILCLLLLIGLFITLTIKEDYRRQRALNSTTEDED